MGTRLNNLFSLRSSWLLLLLQVLLLLRVFLLQLLGLLLMLLFQLVVSGCIRVVLGYTLMFLLLLLLQLLVFLILLLGQIRLLLLIFLVTFRVSRACNSSGLVWLQFAGMGCRWSWNIVLRPTSILRTCCACAFRTASRLAGTTRLRSSAFGWRMVRCTGFPSRHSPLEVSGLRRSCDRRPALIN